ncbi:23S rRNA (uracil(1939)-C(5))-methyltransferase RlmD [Agrilactobacillus fermenti]|uniref:23S rRNA (uracil(1939)-C(5))-methyltransferase RlmD n=1 Tax=Agrilactobacillus fermenti TaxID=2586909 RepID=UPI001E619B13|nr:23S rRNA (uracil(1939)-C(5))-methyltransferase RlmD [Agrilactobacillus fermenti]MCD2255150.1 23S rRNA (uracil(1939)-C(5))-methyltransferase RlmD [Agrilactobacillus fermenti]
MKTNLNTPVQKNQTLDLTAVDLSYDGLGVAKVDDFPIFIDNALPGEVVTAVITKVAKKYAFAKTVAMVQSSPDRVDIKNRRYTQTGIAPLQHLAYPAQLKFKQQQIENLYQKAKLAIDVLPTLGMTDPTHYRNKAQVPVRTVDGQPTVGFFQKRSHRLVPMTDFFIQDEKIDAAIAKLQDLIRQFGISAYDEVNHQGVLRNIMIRRGYYTGEMMIVLITRTKELPERRELANAILAEIPDVVSIIQNINGTKGNTILGHKERILWGKPNLRDELLGLKFDISALSFYQVNPTQTQVLYQKAIEAANLSGDEVVIDAYSGIGTIGLSMAKHVRSVKGVEITPAAVTNANANAELNGITNAEFVVGKAEEVLPQWAEEGMKADLIVVDPPRKGLAPEFIEAAIKVRPKKVLYISCNPATLARDLQAFAAAGYTAKQTQPVDMFPMTTHVESVTVLERTEK